MSYLVILIVSFILPLRTYEVVTPHHILSVLVESLPLNHVHTVLFLYDCSYWDWICCWPSLFWVPVRVPQVLVGFRLEEPRGWVFLHQFVYVWRGFVETSAVRLRQGSLDLLANVMVNVDLCKMEMIYFLYISWINSRHSHTFNCFFSVYYILSGTIKQ